MKMLEYLNLFMSAVFIIFMVRYRREIRCIYKMASTVGEISDILGVDKSYGIKPEAIKNQLETKRERILQCVKLGDSLKVFGKIVKEERVKGYSEDKIDELYGVYERICQIRWLIV